MAKFVDNAKLFQAFVEYRARADVQEFLKAKVLHRAARNRGEEPGPFTLVPPRLPDSIGEAIYKIAHKYAMRLNWRHLHCTEEMIGDAIIHCVSYVHNFDPEKTRNPFAYITTCVNNGFLQRIDKEKHEEDLKTESIKRMAAGQTDSFVGAGKFFVPSYVSSAMDVVDEVEEMNRLHGVRGGSKKERAKKKEVKRSELTDF